MKRISILLVLALLIGMFSAAAFASGSVQLKVAADKSEVDVGDVVTVTVTANNAADSNIAGLEFTLDVTDGLEYVSSTCTTLFDIGVHYQADSAFFSGVADKGINQDSWVILTLSFKAVKSGAQTVTILQDGSFDFYDGDYNDVTYSISGASVTVKSAEPAHTHTYGDPAWTWAADFSTAEAVFTCTDNDDTRKASATITPEVTKAATCAEEGVRTYTATATFDGTDYTDIKTEPIAKTTEHTWDEGVVTKEATCTEEGVKTYTCTVCGETKPVPIDKIPHTPTKHEAVDATCSKEGNIEYWSCDVCGKIFSDANLATEIQLADTIIPIDEDAHDWGEWTVQTPATEEADGVEIRTCKNNPEHTPDTRSIPKLDHVHDMVKTEKVDATCEEDGNIEYYTCSKCGLIFSDSEGKNQINAEDTIVKATGHTYGTPTYVWADDYSSVTATRVCANADHPETETADTTPDETAPTCTEKGSITYTAKFENSIFETQTKTVDGKDALDHDYDYANATYAWSSDYATVTATAKCKHDASHTITETVNTTKETTTAPTCEETGVETYTATFQDAGFTAQTEPVSIDALGHDWGEWTVTTAATCEEEGVETRVCKNDETHTEPRAIEALGHLWGEWEVNKEATADEPGEKIRFCEHDKSHYDTDVLALSTEPATVIDTTVEVSEDIAAAGLATPAAVESKLEEDVVAAVTAAVGAELAADFSTDTIAYYDVKLILKDELGNVITDANGDPVEVTNANMPAGGINVSFNFPAGITADNFSQYTFIVIHMFGEGTNAGSTEQLAPTVSANGITVHVNSLSPFAVAAVKKPVSNTGSGSGAGGVQKTETRASTPHTGDDSAIVLWAVLFLSCGAGAVTLGKKKLYGNK